MATEWIVRGATCWHKVRDNGMVKCGSFSEPLAGVRRVTIPNGEPFCHKAACFGSSKWWARMERLGRG